MPLPPRPALKLPAFALLALVLATGCAPPAATPVDAPSGGEGLPAYAGEDLDLFDDGLDSRAVGLELESQPDPTKDPRFRARSKAADVVLRARIGTVTGAAGSDSRSYQIIFKTVERIGGTHPIGDEFTLHVEKTSPSFGIVKSMEGQLIGKTLVVYVKAFSTPDGQRDLHFHASADEPALVAAVKNTVLLSEMK
jgi:hypothetical protein